MRNYWIHPRPENRPAEYLKKKSWRVVVQMIKKHVKPDETILELGCNSGLTLSYLWQEGYHNLNAIEINAEAVEMLFQKRGGIAKVEIGAIEEKIMDMQSFDLIFSKAVLCHLPRSSDFVFAEIAKRANKILTIEDEKTNKTGRHYARNYQDIFEALGFEQAEYHERVPDMNAAYRARYFERE